MTKPDPPTLQRLLVEAVRRHNVLPLTGRCNLSCRFCSHGQNPPGTQAYTFPPLDKDLLLDLADFLDPDQKIIIGESATRLREGEPLTHPDFFFILGQLRSRFPATLLQVTTNGSLLDGDRIRRLAALAPLELVLSLNSATARGRRLLMNDPDPNSAAAALEKLIRANVPFHGSVVAMPHLAGWEDLTYTLEFLDGAGAKTIRLMLPGFTRYGPPALIPPPGTLERCLDLAEKLRVGFSSPLLAEPPRVDDFRSRIEGVIVGSPAGRAGLKTGDLILAVDGAAALTRVDAYFKAREKENPRLAVLRDNERLQVALLKARREAPGFAVSHDLDPAQVERVRRRPAAGGETLMLLSRAAYPRWQLARERFRLENLKLAAVPALYFGGNINCAGLLTVSDFVAALKKLQPAPRGRILIPAAAFDSSGRDLQGRHYSLLNQPAAEVVLVE